MVFIAIAQVLLAFAPLAEVGVGAASPHVEEAGTAIHHTHDEASCSACVARVLLSSTELADRTTLFFASSAIGPDDVAVTTGGPRAPGGNFSRAPPLDRA
jgi:hypothetical protein